MMAYISRRLLGVAGFASFAFLVIWLALLLFGRSDMLRDPGTLWHVVVGDRMLATGHAIEHDPFSFTFADRPWVADQWLAECGMAAIHRVLGWDGLLLVTASILAAVYAWIAARLRQTGLHWLPVALLVGWTIALGSPQFHVRPLVITIALLAVTFAWLVDVEAGRYSQRRLWLLVPLFLLWTNLHGGVLAGIGTVGLCCAGWTIMEVIGRRQGAGTESIVARGTVPIFADTNGHRAQHGRLVAEMGLFTSRLLVTALPVVLVAVTLINPYGIALPREWLETLAMPLPKLIEEHGRLELTSPLGWATIAMGAGYIAVLVSTYPTRPRMAWLVPLAWFALAVLRVRNAPLFGVTAAIALADMLPFSRFGSWLGRRGWLGPTSQPAGSPSAVLPLAAVALAVVVQLAGLHLPLVGRGWARFSPAVWPVEMLPQLDAISQSERNGAAIFNDMCFGGFLMYHAPRLRVFIDDRCSLYGTKFLTAYESARDDDGAQIDRWQQQYGFHYALVEADGQFDRHLASSPAWKLLSRTEPAALYQLRMGTESSVN